MGRPDVDRAQAIYSIFAFYVSAALLLAGCQAAKAPQTKPVVMRYFPTSDSAIYDKFQRGSALAVTYGEPKEIALIQARMDLLCRQSGASGIQGLPPAYAQRVIQIDDYALVEGACGDPHRHIVVIKHGPEVVTWLNDGCAKQGDARVQPLRDYLATKNGCWIPDDTVARMLLIRSGKVPQYCSMHPQNDVLCPGFRYDTADRRFIRYNRAWIEMSDLGDNGDVAGALVAAQKVLRYQPADSDYVRPCLAELRTLQGLSRAQAAKRWKQFRFDAAPAR